MRTAPVQTPRTDNTILSAVAVGEGKIVYLHDFSDETTPIPKAEKDMEKDGTFLLNADICSRVADMIEELASA